jgi:hypothetical protein
MRRMLLVLFALSSLSLASLQAQTCRGLAPLSSGQLQASGTGKLASGVESGGAALVYDLPENAFGGLGVGMTSVEAFGKSSVDLAAVLGYQFALTGQVQVCPILDAGLQLGPNNAFDSGVDRSTFDAALGLTAGTSISLTSDVTLVPALGVGVGHRTHTAENGGGATLFRIAETYGVAQFHAGLVLDQNTSVRPTLEVPLGLHGGNASVGLTIGYKFGR